MLTINFSSVNVRGVVWDLFSRNFHLQIRREERGVPLHPKVKMPDGRRQRKRTRLMDCEVARECTQCVPTEMNTYNTHNI